jgi:uncharacterized membrane protein YfcA
MSFPELAAGAGVGLAGGFTSGLLGVSPGGGLVVFSVLLLGAEQHVAQGISLIAQIPPTSLAGIKRYWDDGNRTPLDWLVFLAIGFLIGAVGGAYSARLVSSAGLQWTYAGYLAALDAMLIARRGQEDTLAGHERDALVIHWAPLLVIGAIAGFSSGFLGIGGGLATTVGLSVGMKVPQRQAQMMSLVLSTIPMTIPAAWVYWREGSSTTWVAALGVIAGLFVGTDLGARVATRTSRVTLRAVLVGFVSAMAIYMAYKAAA